MCLRDRQRCSRLQRSAAGNPECLRLICPKSRCSSPCCLSVPGVLTGRERHSVLAAGHAPRWLACEGEEIHAYSWMVHWLSCPPLCWVVCSAELSIEISTDCTSLIIFLLLSILVSFLHHRVRIWTAAHTLVLDAAWFVAAKHEYTTLAKHCQSQAGRHRSTHHYVWQHTESRWSRQCAAWQSILS